MENITYFPFFILLAGRDVWMTITRAYADQLASQGSYHRSVLYYLACHDTYKAIEVFKSQAMYRYDSFRGSI